MSDDVATFIFEMKRRAKVRTDRELATLLGFAPSTVSSWRRRGHVPGQAILAFFEALNVPSIEVHVFVPPSTAKPAGAASGGAA